MRQCRAEILGRAGDAGRQHARRGIAGLFGEAGLDVDARGCNVAFGKQHRGQHMMQHRLVRRAAQALFAQRTRLVRLAALKAAAARRTMSLGGGFAHGGAY